MESTVLASKSSWMQRQAEPLQCDEVTDVSDISQPPTLWLQRLVINGDIKMTRIGGNDNCAVLGTKHLDYQTMNRHLKFCGMRFAEGRSRSRNTCHPSWNTLMNIKTSGSQHSATPRRDQRLELDTGNLVWRHSPNAQSCDLAWTAASQGG